MDNGFLAANKFSHASVFYVVLFPALDVASAFPLNGITLGSTLLGFKHGSNIRRVEASDRREVVKHRLLAAIPPIAGACFVRDLGVITDYTGVTGFLIAFVFPAALHMTSRRMCKRRGVRTRTGYESWIDAEWSMGVWGAGLVVFVLGSLVYEAAN